MYTKNSRHVLKISDLLTHIKCTDWNKNNNDIIKHHQNENNEFIELKSVQMMFDNI